MRMLDIGLHESYEKYLENVVETVWASSVCGFFFLLLEKKQEGKKKRSSTSTANRIPYCHHLVKQIQS